VRVELPGGNWAELKPIGELTRADRRAVNAAIIFEQDGGKPVVRASMDDDMFAALAGRVILDWSFPLPTPAVDPNGLDRLTLEQDDELHKAIKPYLDAVLGNHAPVKGNEVPTSAFVS
jgi:hypothetical protein